MTSPRTNQRKDSTLVTSVITHVKACICPVSVCLVDCTLLIYQPGRWAETCPAFEGVLLMVKLYSDEIHLKQTMQKRIKGAVCDSGERLLVFELGSKTKAPLL